MINDSLATLTESYSIWTPIISLGCVLGFILALYLIIKIEQKQKEKEENE